MSNTDPHAVVQRSAIVDQIAVYLPQIDLDVAAEQEAIAAEALRRAQEEYERLRAQAENVLEEAARHPQASVIADDLATIRRERLDAADGLAGEMPPRFGAATDLLGGIADACARARGVADAHAAYLEQLDASEQLVGKLTESVITPDRERIEKEQIDAAKLAAAGRDYVTAKLKLDAVAKHCEAARIVAAQHAIYVQALSVATKAVETLTEDSIETEKQAIQTTLIDPAIKAAKDRGYIEAGELLALVGGRVADAKVIAAKAATFKSTLAALKVRVGQLTDPIAAPEKTEANGWLLKAEQAVAAKKPDYDAALVALQPVAPLCDRGALHARRYGYVKLQLDAECQRFETDVAHWCGVWQSVAGTNVITGVSDELPKAKAAAIGAAESEALLGKYAEAMQLLGTLRGLLGPLQAALGTFIAYNNERARLVALDGNLRSAAAAAPCFIAALDLLVKTHDLTSINAAKSGNFQLAFTETTKWAGPHQAVAHLFPTWQQAVGAYSSLLSEVLIAPDAQRVRVGCLDVASAAIAAMNLAGASAPLATVINEAPKIVAYGIALKTATDALAGGTKLTTQDETHIRTTYIAPAAALALNSDYPGGTALLDRVKPEADAARSAQANVEATRSAVRDAEAKLPQTNTDPDAPLKAVQSLLQPMLKDPYASWMKAEVDALEKLVAEAAAALKSGQIGTVGTKLAAATRLVVPLRAGLENCARFDAACKTLELRINNVDGRAKPEKDTATVDFPQKAKAGFVPAVPGPAFDLLAKGTLACLAAEQLVPDIIAYENFLAPALNDIATLTDPFLTVDKTKLEEATTQPAAVHAANRRFHNAYGSLSVVPDACNVARLILGEKKRYDNISVLLVADWKALADNLNLASSNGLAPRAELNAVAADVKANHLDAAANLVATRGLYHPGLQQMRNANALLISGGNKAIPAKLESEAYVNAASNRASAEKDLKALKDDAALKTKTAADALANEIGQMDKAMADASKLEAVDKFPAAKALYANVSVTCKEAMRIALAAAKYETDRKAAELRIDACKRKVDTLAPVPAGIAERFAAMQNETIAQAANLAAARDWPAGSKLLDTVEERCATVEALVTSQTDYAAALHEADEALRKLPLPDVQAEAARISDTLIGPAKTAAATLDYATAETLLSRVAEACASASRIADGGKAAAAERQGATDALSGTSLPDAIAAVEKLLEPLLNHAQAGAISDLTDRVQATINAAKHQPPPDNAIADLTAAADLCPPARVAADRHQAFATALLRLETAAASEPLTKALVKREHDTIVNELLVQAKALADPPERKFADAMVLLDRAETTRSNAAALVARDAAVQKLASDAQAALDLLGALKPTKDPMIGDAAEVLQKQRIDEAVKLAGLPDRKFDAAEKLLAGFAGDCKALGLRKKMQGGTAPDESDFAALLAEPDGAKQLDNMIAGLPDNTAQAILETAIKLRFKLDSFQNLMPPDPTQADPSAKSLKKIYQLMAKVPENTVGSPSLRSVERFGGDSAAPFASQGSFYDQMKKKVVLSIGRAEDPTQPPWVHDQLALPDVDPDAELEPDDKVAPPKLFDWITLHELGHAIDDKKRWMQSKDGDPAFGGWTLHGTNVAPVAEAIVTATNFEATGRTSVEKYLTAYLLGGGTAVAPVSPDPLKTAEWNGRLKDAREWCDAIRIDKSLWNSGGESAKRAMKGRVYQEAYPGMWVSYDLGARSKGITGYQFRAPGEWLAELYAAFHTNKLKQSHPAAAWLATL